MGLNRTEISTKSIVGSRAVSLIHPWPRMTTRLKGNMADISNMVEELSKLTVIEAAELVKQLETKWGVSAAAPAAAAAGASAGAAAAPAVEVKTAFDVILASVPA